MLDPSASLADTLDPFRTSVDSFDSCEPLNSDITRHAFDEAYTNWHADQGLQFRTHHHMADHDDDDDSGSSSPTLWKTSTTPPRVPLHSRHHRSLSPTSRAQAIARGQRELMDMVKNMPEASYELSLKDLVEHPHTIRIDNSDQEECLIQGERNNYGDDPRRGAHQRVVNKVRRQASVKAKMVRSGSIDNRGLFLKMVFPITWKPQQKKNSTTSTSASRVSPKAEVLDKSSRTRSVDKDWWKRRFSISSESESGISSSNSGSSGSSGSGSSGSRSSHQSIRNRRRNGLLNNCCSCFQSRQEDKSAE